jgi:multidrug resistance efflux pump
MNMSDYRTTTGEPLPDGVRQKRRLRRLWIKRAAWTLPAVLMIGFIIPIRIRVAASGYVTTDHYAEVRPPITGPVAEILVTSGQRVLQGDLLVRLDDSAARAALEEAAAAVRQTEARLARREAELAQEKRQRGHLVNEARLRLEHAEVSLKMTQELHSRGLSSGKALEDQKMNLALAGAAQERLRDEDETLDEKELEELRRELDVKRSAAAKAQAELQSRSIHAPISGETVRYEFVNGELVTPESVLYEIFGGDRLILKLRIPERHAAQVTAGDPYRARLSIYTGIGQQRFRGVVSSLRSVIQSDNQQHYRMAYCTFDDLGMAVPPGTSAEARITVATVPLWFWLAGVR